LLILAGLAILLAWGIARRRSGNRCNVVLLVVDAASARYLSCYGNELRTTPQIDALAQEATLFERAYAQAAWTLPSAGSYLTGYYPPTQPRTKTSKVILTVPIAAVLRRLGMQTAAFSENPYVTEGFGLNTGFDLFKEYFPFEAFDKTRGGFERIDSAKTVSDVIDWLDENGRDPNGFFLYVHLLPPHAPYDPPPPFAGRYDVGYDGRIEGTPGTLAKIDKEELQVSEGDLAHLRAKYQENLAFADYQVGRILQRLRDGGVLDETLLIITSDHGEAFREHGRMMHNSTVYEEMIHVPLIVRFPSRVGEVPRRWKGVVELADIMPTVCDVLGFGLSKMPHGRSLLERLQEGNEADGFARSWSSMMSKVRPALISQEHKLILDPDTGQVELYDLRADPAEKINIAASNPVIVDRLKSLLLAEDASTIETEEVSVNEEVEKRLRSLGYVE